MTERLSILNSNPQKIPGPELLHHLVANPVDGSKIAIDYSAPDGNVECLTYAELHRRVEALAEVLRKTFTESNASPKSAGIVPVFIPQCPHLYISELAVLKAGGAFCPIALDVPEERLRFILNDVGARVFLTIHEFRDGLPELDGISIIAVDDHIYEDTQLGQSIDVSPSDPAYVMYTSGSTGMPKGVVLSHAAATQALLAHEQHIPSFSRFLQFANPTFDVSVFEIFFPLFRASTLVCGDRRQLLNDLPGFINRMNIDAAELTPSVASSLLNGRRSVPSLRLLLSIGEMLKREVIDEFGGDGNDSSILWGMYGPTEATIHCTLQTAFSREMNVGVIGFPLTTVSAFVVQPQTSDEPNDINILPVGEEGELVVGGHQLADGYLNRPEQTEAAFVHHSVYGKLYRTGDRARLTSDGKLECLGRISSGQVKLRGQRIELGEVEYAASKTPGCKSTIADVINGSLVVFCVCDQASTDQHMINQTCREWLPKFMVPADVLILEALPYLASGKVDKKALQQLYGEAEPMQNGANHTLPQSSKAVIEIISDVLEVPIDSDTQLPAVGLDSLSSIRISSRLKQAGFPQPDATSLLESRTVQDIARELDKLKESETPIYSDDLATPSGVREKVFSHFDAEKQLDEVEDAFAATTVQSAMLYETAQESRAYCNWIELALSDCFKFEQVHRSLHLLAKQHSLLRSGFVPLEGEKATHAVVVWKSLHPSQIQRVDDFRHDFTISNDRQLLRPSSFQIRRSNSGFRVLLKIHHALYDQWSIDILRADLGALLQGQRLCAPTSFQLVSASHTTPPEDHLEFWQDHLRDFSPTPLPMMNGKILPRKLQRTSWRELAIDLPSLRQWARELGCSAPAIFQAAMSYLVGCYSGSSDVCYGLVVSGRHIPVAGIDRVFGPCLATLPLRIDYSTTATCLDLLRMIQERNRAMQKYAFTPLAEIKKAASCPSDSQLFDILFVWQESSIAFNVESEFVQEIDSADHHEFNLVIEFEPSEGGIRARATYQQAMMTHDQTDIMFDQLQSLAKGLLADPDCQVAQLARSIPEKYMSIANPSPSTGGDGRSLSASLEEVADSKPNAPALVFARSITDVEAETEVLSFKELHMRASRLANFLRSLHILPGELVCICMEKCVEFYIAVLATLKIGAGYLPLVPETPQSRIQSILGQATVKLCLCDSESQSLFGWIHDTVLDVRQIDLRSFEAQAPRVKVPGSSIAYTVFTSGSTGEPKGVAVTNDNLLGNLQVLAELYQVKSGDRILQACSHAFDVSVFEIFFALYTGICLNSATKDVLFQNLESSIRALGITHLSLTPTVAALVDPSTVPSVRFLVTAGEGVTDLVHRRWAGKGLHQGYGPSETTNICSVKMAVSIDDATTNIGPPLRNTSAFVISTNAEFDVLPTGSIGELAFGGEQVFHGYMAREKLTAEKIILHPQFGRIYRSGDVGRILPDGSLLISGRLDDQVKIRGNRIELGEINSVLLGVSGIRDCTTIVTGENTTEQSLASFVVFEQDQTATLSETAVATGKVDRMSGVLSRLEDSLPGYMRPSVVLPVTQLPLTSQGKLDKRHLRSLLAGIDMETRRKMTSSIEERSDSDEWSSQEKGIAAALARTLQISEPMLNRNTHFSAVGLTSLNAMAFSKLVSRSLNTEAKVSTILRNPSISRLSKALDQQSESQLPNGHLPNGHSKRPALLPFDVIEHAQSTSASSKEEIESVLPCTALQEAMLSASATSSWEAYSNSSIFRISADLPSLKHSWGHMIARHSILRTSFVETESPTYPYVQVALRGSPLPWSEHSIDADDRDPSTVLELPTELSKVDARTPFAIDAITSASQRWLVLHMHHAIYDGISMSQLLKEVEQDYRGKPLEPIVHFQPFLEEAKTHQDNHAIEFWRQHLQGFRPQLFPAVQHAHRSKEQRSIESALSISLDDMNLYCQRHTVSQLSVFQTALAKTLARCQSTDDICFGNVVSGRTVPMEGIERLVAPCFNTLPVRVNLKHMTSNLKVAQRLHQANIEALSYQLTPLRIIQSRASSTSTRLFDSLLIVQPPRSRLDEDIWSLEREDGGMNLPVVFEIIPVGGRYALSLHYLQSSVSTDLAQRLCGAFASALQSCLRYPSSSIEHFQGFDQSTIAGCLSAGNATNGDSGQSSEQNNGHWSAKEDAVRDVFVRLTGVDKHRIGKDTSMYQVGLDSLNAAQVASQLRSLGLNVDASDVIESLTPRSISLRAPDNESPINTTIQSFDLEDFDQRHRAIIRQRLRLTDDAVEAIRPCTPVQGGMLAQSLQTKGKLYINHIAYRVPKSVSESHIKQALNAVTGCHQALRMGFHQIENVQIPFAMSILRQTGIPDSIRTVNSTMNLEDVEEMATNDIMESMDKQAWRATILPGREGMIMVLSLHHAMYDAKSLRIILEDLHKATSSVQLDAGRNIDPLLSSILARAYNSEGATAKFWKEALHDATISKFPDLTPDRVSYRQLQTEYRAASLRWSQVESFCRETGCTVQAVGQATWALLLAAYTGEDSVTFGTVFSGNQSASVAFPDINTIPVPCNTSCSISDLVKKMVDYNASAQRHRFAALTDIQQWSGFFGQSLFDTVFVYQKEALSSGDFDWPTIRETASVDYAASLEIENSADEELTIRLTFDIRRILTQQASLLLQQYDHLMSQVVTGNDRCPQSIYSILPAREPTLPTEVRLLHEFVEQGAREYPNRVALEFVYDAATKEPSAKRWTYRQLDARSNQVAHLLQQHKVQSGDIVAVCMEKRPEASFAFIGILKAGCAFLAIDPELPKSRIDFILKDSEASLLLVDKSQSSVAREKDVRCIMLEERTLFDLPHQQPMTQTIPEGATCYCLYTSGTTGNPKGCEITHENTVQAMIAFQRLFAGRWKEDSRWLQFASYWFDVSVLEQFWSWGAGITVVGAARDLVLEDLPGFLHTMRITHIDLTPSLARLLSPEDVPDLCGGVFITGGEALKQEIIDAWGPERTICNGYGPTEATIGVTMNTFIDGNAKPSNIGHQFDNVGSYVMRPGTDEPVLRGGIGELCVSGKLVGKGYLNRPDLTSKSFPLLNRFQERVYRTGDLVRMLADGSFSFVGRQDLQAKLRGQRLEIAEIDCAVRESVEGITDVSSMVVKDKGGSKETLVSFVVPSASNKTHELQVDLDESSRLLAKQAKAACRKRLPGYMVPTHIIPISFLPLTVNKKVDTKRLLSLFRSIWLSQLQKLDEDGDSTRALNRVEQNICSVIDEVLQLDSHGVDPSSNIFSLGLSSISAISFSKQLKKAGFKRANVPMIISNPTIGALAAALSEEKDQTEAQGAIQQARLSMNAFARRYRSQVAHALCLSVDDIATLAPCTPLQQGLLLESLRDNSRPYFNDFRYLLKDVENKRLWDSIQRLSDSTEILRTRFCNTDDGFAQAIFHNQRLPTSERSVPLGDVDDAAHDLKARWLARNEDNVSVPFEVHLIRTSQHDMLIVHIHHALYDGITYDLLLKQLTKIYHGAQELDIGPGFVDAIAYGPLRPQPRAKEFWTKRLKGTQHVPLDTMAATNETSNPAETASRANTADIEAARKQLGISHQALLQAIFEIAILKHAPRTQTYGIVVSGRSIDVEGADSILGPMFNTLPQPLHIDANVSFSDHAKRCHHLNIEALPFQHTPLRDIRRWCSADPMNTMFDILFVFQSSENKKYTRRDELFEPVETHPSAEYPLACEVEMTADGSMKVVLLAQPQYFDRDNLQAILHTFMMALDCAVECPDKSIAKTFDIVTTKEEINPRNDRDIAPQVNGVSHFDWDEKASRVRNILARLTGAEINDIDEKTTIFALGMDSIDAVKLASRLKNAGMSIPVSKLLRAQTVPRMMSMMQDNGDSSASKSRSNLELLQQQLDNSKIASSLPNMGQIERILPATPHQEGLVADMLRSELQEYFNHDVLRLESATDLDQLKSAWQTIFDTSPVLRTSFKEPSDFEINATFAQVVYRPGPVHFDERRLDDTKHFDDLFDEIRREVLVNVEHRPLVRLTIIYYKSERYLVLSLAHALYDGHSLALVHEDVQRAYHGTLSKRPSNDSAIEAALAATGSESQRFWGDTLSGTSIHSFPRSRQDAGESTSHFAEKCSGLTSERARSFCQTHEVSMQALVQTCWAVTLAHYTRQLEVLFGLVLACRDSEEAEQVAFPMMNTVVMRSSLHGSRVQMLQYMQSTFTDMLPNQRTPLRQIQAAAAKEVQKSTSESGNGLFDTLFIYQHKPESTEDLSKKLYQSTGGRSSVEYPVAVEMESVGDELFMRATCKDYVLDQQGTMELLDKMERVLQAIVNSPNEPTVAFNADKVSLCGLESFVYNTPDQVAVSKPSEETTSDEPETKEDSPLIHTILKAFAQVSQLPVSDLKATSTIESIGIDSISAIKVSSLLRKQSIKVNVSDILKAKTAAKIARIAGGKADVPQTPEVSSAEAIADVIKSHGLNDVVTRTSIDVDNVHAVLPATAGQVYMLSMWQKTRGQLFYPTFSYQLTADFDLKRIEQAWSALVSRHNILRTVFCKTGNGEVPLLQIVLKKAPDGSNLDKGSNRQPMVSPETIQKDGGYQLNLTIHHALYDAVSLPLLMEDFQSLLVGTLPSSTKQKFEDFLALSLTPSARKSSKAFWTQYLRDVKPKQLTQPSVEGPQKRVEIFSPQLFANANDLEVLARKEGVSTQALLFAAYAKVYASFASASVEGEEEDVVLGIYLSNRSHLPLLDSLAAPTINLVPLLVRSPQQRGLLELARRVHADLQEIGTAGNSAVGLWEVEKWTGAKVDTFVNFLKLPDRSEEEGRVEGDGGGVVLKALDERRVSERHEVVEPGENDFELPAEMGDMKTLDVYQHSLDIEMTITDGKVDVGLFAPEAMVGLEEGENVLKELRAVLEKFVGKARE